MLALLFVFHFLSSVNAQGTHSLTWNQGPCSNPATDCWPGYPICGNLTPSQTPLGCICNLDASGNVQNSGSAGLHLACCKGNGWCQTINGDKCPSGICTWFCNLNATDQFFHTCYNIQAEIASRSAETEIVMPVPASVALIFAAFFMGIILSYGVYKVAKIRKTYTSTAPQPLADDSQRSHEMEETSSPGSTENRRLTNQV